MSIYLRDMHNFNCNILNYDGVNKFGNTYENVF